VGAETGERGGADAGDVEERLRRLEGAVEIAVIDESPGEGGADAGELRKLDGTGRIEFDGEPQWDGGGGVVVHESTMKPPGGDVPDRHSGEAHGDDNSDQRLGAPGELMLDGPLELVKSLVHGVIVPPSPTRCRRGTLPGRRASVPAAPGSVPEVT
jgi:hypothetical protein